MAWLRPCELGFFWLLFGVFGCAGGESIDTPGGASDTSPPEAPEDTGTAIADSAAAMDTTVIDMTVIDTTVIDTTVIDTSAMDTTVIDTTAKDTSVTDTGFDSGFKSADHVHIYIDNFCKVSVSPTSFTVPAGETLNLTYHNHSVDYAADVWMMYGGGFLDLAKGASWVEKYSHCFGPSPSTGYADISIAGGPTSGCPGVRLNIVCK